MYCVKGINYLFINLNKFGYKAHERKYLEIERI